LVAKGASRVIRDFLFLDSEWGRKRGEEWRRKYGAITAIRLIMMKARFLRIKSLSIFAATSVGDHYNLCKGYEFITELCTRRGARLSLKQSGEETTLRQM
jgi:hypothetical protein